MSGIRWTGPGLSVLVLLGLVLGAPEAHADAIVISRAASASTIAEIFVERGEVRVELEIGGAELPAFRNLLPDGAYETLTGESVPFERRQRSFFAEDLRISAAGVDVAGRIVSLAIRDRIGRDPITGEPLPATGEEPEKTLVATLAYDLPHTPASLTIRSERLVREAAIGFVLYPAGLAVNDFRYLSVEQTVDLDWTDPWYSAFRRRPLRRRFDAPLSVFLYVEPLEVRKEIVVRPRDLQQWTDLGIADQDTLRAADWARLKESAAAFLMGQGKVTIDGEPGEPVLDRIHFVRRTLRRTGVIDPPEDLSLDSATLGVIFVYPIDGLPQEVSMSWGLFPEKSPRVPSSATDEAGGLPSVLSPDDSVLVWRNFLKNPTSRALVEIDPPAPPRSVPVLSVLCFLGGGALALRGRGAGLRRRAVAGVAVLLVAGIAAWPFARIPLPGAGPVDDEQAATVVQGLLTNVYRSFDYRDEERIYDRLAASADGELLTRIYLETREALELRNQGGARVKVQDVRMEAVETSRPDDGEGFRARCTWEVAGSVGHWGHLHVRENRYEAVLTVRPVDGRWKITALELLNEERVS